MGIGADTDFDAEELALLESLRKTDEQQAAEPAAAAPAAAPAATAQPSEQPGATAQTQQQVAAPAEPAAAAPAAQAQPTEAQPQGDPRAALRAARRSERQARERAAQLEAELEALRKQVPQAPANTDDLTDAELAELEQDFPAMAKAARLARKAAEAVGTQQPAAQAPAAQPEFMPPALPPELQEVVDDIPALLAWQCNPDQTAFDLAKATDATLMAHPVWKTKPLAERFAEVTRRVQAELGAAAAPQPSQQQQPAATPAQVLANVPRQAPSTLSDIGAGGTGVENPLTLDRMARMSDEDILAELARLG